jgi:WD40 repeat protein
MRAGKWVMMLRIESDPRNQSRSAPVRGWSVLKSVTLQGIVALSAVLLPLSAHCDSGSGLLTKIFGIGSNMNDVATKVADLPETYRDVNVRGLDFSPDGGRLAVVSDHENINIWDWRRSHIEKTLEQPRGFNPIMTINPIQFSPDGRLLAACAGKGVGDVVVRIWNTADWSIAKDLTDTSPGGCDGIGFTPNGQNFVRIANRFSAPDDFLVVYGVGAWQRLWGLSMENFWPISVAISPDGGLAAIGGTLTTVPPEAREIRDPAQRLQTIRHDVNIYIISLQQHKTVRVIRAQDRGAVAWSPDGGARLAMVGGPHVEIFDSETGQNLLREAIENSGHMNVRYSSDGRYFIESDTNGRGTGLGVKIWDGQRHALLKHIPGDTGSIAVSRDGRYLAVGGAGRTAIWQLK